jgi:hypothetical protein
VIGRESRGREEAGLGRVDRKGKRAARGKRKNGGREERWVVGRKGKGKGFSLFFSSFFQILLNNFSKPF